MKTDVYRLSNGTSMSIAPEYGCNMFSWTVGGREILHVPDNFGKSRGGYYTGGNPILYPSVGRTWYRNGGKTEPDKYMIYGRRNDYRMPCHGIVPFGRWKRTKEHSSKGHILAEYSFSLPVKAMLEHYPFDISFSLRYDLEESSVGFEAVFKNNGTVPAPLAFGFHPYFRISDRDNTIVNLPCKKRVLLEPELLIPTGGGKLLSPILPFEKGNSCDKAFADMNGRRATVLDRSSGNSVNVDFDENIEMLVVYSEADSDYVCLEPWTGGLGAYEELKRENWAEAGRMPVLQSRETRKLSIKYSIV